MINRLQISLHALQRYAERVLEQEPDLYLNSKQRRAIHLKILEDIGDFEPITKTQSMIIRTKNARYLIKNNTVVTVNPPETSRAESCGCVTRGSKKKYKEMGIRKGLE